MSAVVSGTSLGLVGTSNSTVGASGKAQTGSNGEAVYVNAATGNLVVQSGNLTTVVRPVADITTVTPVAAMAQSNPVTLYSQSGYGGSSKSFGAGVYSGDDLGDLKNNVVSARVAAGWRLTVYYYADFSDPTVLERDLSEFAGSTYHWRNDNAAIKVEYVGATASFNRLSSSTFITYTYDELGRLRTQTDGSGTTKYRYDMSGNVTLMSQPGALVTSDQYDAQGRKTSEANANGDTARWTYDYFGRLTSHVDLGGALWSYAYDGAGQLTSESNTRGRDVKTRYDKAGQVISIDDMLTAISARQTRYAYDLGGRRTEESITLYGASNYSNQKSFRFNELGQMTYAGAATEDIYYEYDTVGNRTKLTSFAVGFAPDTRCYAYDAMNRQVLVDGARNNNVNDASNISATQGHLLSYDLNGNRLTDRSSVDGNYRYGYDALGRLVTINGVTVRKYDAADRVVWGMTAPDTDVVTLYRDNYFAGNAQSFDGALSTAVYLGDLRQVGNDAMSSLRVKAGWTAYLYSDDNFVGHQRVVTSDTVSMDSAFNDRLSSLRILPNSYINTYNAAGDLVAQDVFAGADNQTTHIENSYDRAHNLTRSIRKILATGGFTETTSTAYVKYEGYRQGAISASRDDNPGQVGSTNFGYDVNGYLIAITDGQGKYARRDFINDVSGQVLQKSQDGKVLRTLVANGQVLRYAGTGTNPDMPVNADGSVNYVSLNDANIAFQAIDSAHPGNVPAQIRVNPGDTLKSIAQAMYGDSALWYLIADANGLRADDALPAGRMLSLPNTVGTVHNNASTFKPFNAGLVIGDTSPYLPAPAASSSGPSCGQIAIIVAAVLAAVVVAVVTAGVAAPALAGAFGAIGLSAGLSTMAGSAVAGAIGGALGSALSQGIMIAGGLQSQFSWTDVAIGAVSGLVAGGIAGKLRLASQSAKALAEAGRELSLGQKLLLTSLNSVRQGNSSFSILAARTVISSAGNALQNMSMNAVGQGIKIAARQQTSFQWSQVASSAVTGAFSGAGSSLGRVGAVAGDIAGSAVGNVIVNDGAFDPSQFVADVSSSFGSVLIGGVDLGGVGIPNGAARGKGRGPALNRFVAVARKNGGNNYVSSTRTNRAGTQAIVDQAGDQVVVLSGLHGGKGPTQYSKERAFYEQDLTVDKRPGQSVEVYDVFNPATRADMLEAMNQRNTDVVYAYCFSRGKTMFTRRPSVAGELNNYWEKTPPN